MNRVLLTAGMTADFEIFETWADESAVIQFVKDVNAWESDPGNAPEPFKDFRARYGYNPIACSESTNDFDARNGDFDIIVDAYDY